MPAKKPLDISITGDKLLDRAFQNYEKRTQKLHLTRGLRSVAKQVQSDAVELVPEDTGTLREDLERTKAVKALKRSRTSFGFGIFLGQANTAKEAKTQTPALPGAFHGRSFYGSFVELGTQHTEADPFLRPALWANSKNLVNVMTAAIRKSIADVARKGKVKK